MERNKILKPNIDEEVQGDSIDFADNKACCSTDSQSHKNPNGITALSNQEKWENRLDQDSLILQSLLPENTWEFEIIAAHLADNPDIMETLINSSPYFRELLKNKRVLFLSKKVLKIFYHWMCSKFPECKYSNRGFVLKPKEKAELFQWRQVCSSWRLSFDQLAEEGAISSVIWLEDHYFFTCKSQITKFMNHFAKTHPPTESSTQNPFIGESLWLRFEEDTSLFLKPPLTLLRMYGGHIRHIWFEYYPGYGSTPEEQYLKWHQMVKFTPNLKTLSLTSYRFSDNLDSEFIREHPPPKLECLEKLIVKDVSVSLFDELIRSNDHIKSLKVCYQNEYDFDVDLKYLEECEIYLNDASTFSFIPLEFSTSPLKKLRFMCCLAERRWGELFRKLEDAWGSTLEELEFYLPEATTIAARTSALQDSLNCRLNLPKVKKLNLVMSDSCYAIDFMLGLENLESCEIHIYSLFETPEDYNKCTKSITMLQALDKQIVEWVEFTYKMYQSNIWTLFKKLKCVKRSGSSYHRFEYLDRKRTEIK